MNYSIKSVVVIDDDIDDLELAKEAISNSSMKCLLFTGAQGFYDFLAGADTEVYPFMIFLDLNMPRISGFDVLHYLKTNSRYKDIPVVILTTSTRKEDRVKSSQLGADGFVTKPSSYTQMENIVNAFTKHFSQEIIIQSN